MISRKTVVLLLAILMPFLAAEQSFPQRTKSSLSSGNQRHSEKSLKDNKYFFNFINPAVSNFGIEEEKTIFTEALRRDLIARMLYMRFSFDLSFEEIKKSQVLLIDLYRKVLKRENEATKSLLNSSAAEVMKSDNYMARKYLSLGYRSFKWAEKVVLMADNLPENNYTVKLYEYVKAIKNIKVAKRYAIIALLENRITEQEIRRVIEEEIKRFEDEKKSQATEKEKKRIRDRVKQSINYNSYDKMILLIEKYIPESRDKYLLLHKDNYYKIDTGASLYDTIMDNPGLENIPEYSTYQKDQ